MDNRLLRPPIFASLAFILWVFARALTLELPALLEGPRDLGRYLRL
jgi:hypothetical protein